MKIHAHLSGIRSNLTKPDVFSPRRTGPDRPPCKTTDILRKKLSAPGPAPRRADQAGCLSRPWQAGRSPAWAATGTGMPARPCRPARRTACRPAHPTADFSKNETQSSSPTVRGELVEPPRQGTVPRRAPDQRCRVSSIEHKTTLVGNPWCGARDGRKAPARQAALHGPGAWVAGGYTPCRSPVSMIKF